MSVLAVVLQAALEAQAVFGVADASQRFAPVAAPSGWADPCRGRWPAHGWVQMATDGAPKSIHNESWLDSVAGWTGTRILVGRRRGGVWHASEFDPCENRWSALADTPQLAFVEPWPSDGHDRPFQPWHPGGSDDAFDRISVWDAKGKAWRAIKAASPLGPRAHYAVALAGRRFLVWGGWRYPGVLGDGAVLDLAAKTWKKMSSAGAPSPRLEPTAVVWTGSRLLVWGGRNPTSARPFGDGAAYDPAADRWRPISSVNAPSPRTEAAIAWTGRKLVVVGGSAQLGGPPVHDGAIYDPALDRWTPLEPPPHGITLPHANVGPLARILVAPDGRVVFLPDNLGEVAVLDAERARWTTVDARGPGKRNSYRAFLIGRRLIVWGGLTLIAEHRCPPPVPGRPICDSFAETASHDDGWMIELPD